MLASPLQVGRLLAYPVARAVGRPLALPLNLTVSVTYRCGSRCLTCDVWKRQAQELSVEELARVFRSLGPVPWVTVSGGDQFLRGDLAQIIALIRSLLRPTVINLPMNGLLPRRIERLLPEIVRASVGSQLVLNLSVDEIGAEHDRLRGVSGSFERVRSAFELVRRLQREHRHIVVGIHTVVSRFNVQRLPQIAAELRAWGPDSYITEIAENRVELETMSKQIAPSPEDYAVAVASLKQLIRRQRSASPLGRLVEALRLEYYDLALAIVRRRTQVIPCYAGLASAQLAPDGHLWGCCVRAESLGNVRDVDYDFRRVWRSAAADRFRRSVAARECACPLASASYTNMLLAPASLARVARNCVL